MEVLEIARVRVEHIAKSYMLENKRIDVFRDLNFEFNSDEITVILGKSGCGKTTFLRILSGLEEADSGKIAFLQKEKIGIVFQEARLMPWLSCRKNIAFGLKRKEYKQEHIDALIEMAGLKGFEDAYPNQLSGGMQQRVALARALAYNPSMILLDEPFAALDYFTRMTMQNELIKIQGESKKGFVFVTHNIDEALLLGKKIVVFEDGEVKKIYDLSAYPYARDMLSRSILMIKKDILDTLKPECAVLA